MSWVDRILVAVFVGVIVGNLTVGAQSVIKSGQWPTSNVSQAAISLMMLVVVARKKDRDER